MLFKTQTRFLSSFCANFFSITSIFFYFKLKTEMTITFYRCHWFNVLYWIQSFIIVLQVWRRLCIAIQQWIQMNFQIRLEWDFIMGKTLHSGNPNLSAFGLYPVAWWIVTTGNFQTAVDDQDFHKVYINLWMPKPGIQYIYQ